MHLKYIGPRITHYRKNWDSLETRYKVLWDRCGGCCLATLTPQVSPRTPEMHPIQYMAGLVPIVPVQSYVVSVIPPKKSLTLGTLTPPLLITKQMLRKLQLKIKSNVTYSLSRTPSAERFHSTFYRKHLDVLFFTIQTLYFPLQICFSSYLSQIDNDTVIFVFVGYETKLCNS